MRSSILPFSFVFVSLVVCSWVCLQIFNCVLVYRIHTHKTHRLRILSHPKSVCEKPQQNIFAFYSNAALAQCVFIHRFFVLYFLAFSVPLRHCFSIFALPSIFFGSLKAFFPSFLRYSMSMCVERSLSGLFVGKFHRQCTRQFHDYKIVVWVVCMCAFVLLLLTVLVPIRCRRSGCLPSMVLWVWRMKTTPFTWMFLYCCRCCYFIKYYIVFARSLVFCDCSACRLLYSQCCLWLWLEIYFLSCLPLSISYALTRTRCLSLTLIPSFRCVMQ